MTQEKKKKKGKPNPMHLRESETKQCIKSRPLQFSSTNSKLRCYVMGEHGVEVNLIVSKWSVFGRANCRSSSRCRESCASTQVRVRSWDKDNLAVRRLGHRLISLKLTNLHGRCRGQDISSLAHEFGYHNCQYFPFSQLLS